MFKQREKEARKIGHSGFTLVELLVVISIISMLMSILLPSLSRAREAGQRAHCLYNLRGLTLAWTMYAMDNEGKLCSPNTWWQDWGTGNHWVADGPKWQGRDRWCTGNTEKAIKDGVLWPYTQSLGLYKCKRDQSGLLRSYSMSETMGGLFPTQGICPEPEFASLPHKNWPFRTLEEIYGSAERMVFIDAERWGTARWLAGGFKPCIDVKTSLWLFYNWNSLTARHGHGCNLSFADGHCEYWKWKSPDEPRESPSAAYDDIQHLWKSLKGRKY
ncbi:MAG: prepilin-type N-terminal cleavage/methylation domain-containing protein [Planctomycetota bacterium]|jgi:prepilin-type N-terminal cleavage/methylation domain-containing protein/prepilin-type processing-associated H-X9-DG protein